MKIFDWFKGGKARGSYIAGTQLGCGAANPLWVTGEITNSISNSSLDVFIQDQTSPLVSARFAGNLGSITLASDTVVDNRTLLLVAGHGVVTGNLICLRQGERFFQGRVTNVATNTITMDTPLDYAFPTSSVATKGAPEMNVDGSVTPVIFRVSPIGLSADVSWDISRLSLHLEDNTAMDDTKFGGGVALANGFVLRKANHEFRNIFSARDNGDIMDYCENSQYNDKAGGGYGLRCFRTFGGQSADGVVIRLSAATSDELQIVIQDNLTGLTGFHAVAMGSYVVN